MNQSPNRFLNIWPMPWFQRWVAPGLIFLIAFLPRAIYSMSRPHVWFYRSYTFANAIIEQDWASTFQRYHPGVSLMWLSGLGIELFQRIFGEIQPEQFLGLEPSQPGILIDATTAGILPLAIALALCIALTYPLLSRLAGTTIALIAGLLLALDPFHITYSKVLHLDALLASVMIVSALFLLVYLREKRWPDLVFSGLFAGLAFLTKSPSIFLILYAALIVGVSYFSGLFDRSKERRWDNLGRQIWPAARTMIVWAAIAIVTFLILFPAMWVEPGEVLSELLNSIIAHTATPHKNPVFFAGRLWENDPGIRFHLAILLWKTTALTLPLIAAAVIWALKRFRDPESKTLWALIAYAFFFTLQMGLADKKQMAYIVPAFPALSIIASYGLVWTIDAFARWRRWQPGGWRSLALLGLAVVIQAVLVLRHHPYYGAQHNLLAGGSPAAAQVLPMQDQGEGLDLAARFLNQLPYGQDKRATVFRRNAYVFERYYDGLSMRDMDPIAAYRIYDLNSVMREFQGEPDWLEAWQRDQQTEPLHTIELDGLTYVWIYGQLPEDPTDGGPSADLEFKLGDATHLRKVSLNALEFVPGEPLVVALEWQAQQDIGANLTVFTHLLSSEGELIAQQDNIPLFGARSTTTWRVGEILQDVHLIWLPEDLLPGEYDLSAGMYDTETIVRLPVYDENGDRLPEDRAPLGKIRIVADEP